MKDIMYRTSFAFQDDVDEFRKYRDNLGKKIVLWGCGRTGVEVNRILESCGICPDVFIDSDSKKWGTAFAHSSISSPDVLGSPNEYYVLIASAFATQIENKLMQLGFNKKTDFEAVNLSRIYTRRTLCLLNTLTELHSSISCYIFIDPSLEQLVHPSVTEKMLQHLPLLVNDKIDWLKHNPPHIATAHESLPQYSDSYIRNIFSGYNPIHKLGKYIQPDMQSTYVNVVGGYRVTTNCPCTYKNRIHMFGQSTIYGIGVEDQYTIPSCVQRLVNEWSPNTYQVINHGIKGLPVDEYSSVINGAVINSEDVVIVFVNREAGRVLSKYAPVAGIPVYDLQSTFNRPHDFGEVFADTHLHYRGTIIAAQVIFEVCFAARENYRNWRKKESTVPRTATALMISEEFSEYIEELKSIKKPTSSSVQVGSIVMNGNPFTLGHRYLIETAATQVDILYVFVVQEDASQFSFADRFELIKQGTSDIENVVICPSGGFIVSSKTFPEYFDKENNPDVIINTSTDLELFGAYIAPILNITVRFAGQEPFDIITRQYNESMRHILPRYGVTFTEIPRKEEGRQPISASRVRKLLVEGDWDTIQRLVPISTLRYLKKWALKNT